MKNPSFTGVTKNQYIRRNCLKRGGLDSLQFKGDGGELAEKEGVVFLRGGLIPQCTLLVGQGFKAILLRKVETGTKIFH